MWKYNHKQFEWIEMSLSGPLQTIVSEQYLQFECMIVLSTSAQIVSYFVYQYKIFVTAVLPEEKFGY